MYISRTMAYALEATLQLAKQDGQGPVSCRRLAGSGGMPRRFLMQILRMLVERGIVDSTRGVVGGYRLMRKPEQISLLDLFEAIQGPIVGVVSSSHLMQEDSRYVLQAICDDVAASTRARLSAVSLAQLLANVPAVTNALETPTPVILSMAPISVINQVVGHP
jgi:Rrf2 family protein